MRQDQYAKMATHPLRQVFRNMIQDARDLPSRSELREAIEEACPPGTDAAFKEKLFDTAIRLAEAAQTQGRGAWFDLRGEADERVLAVVEGWEAADRILPAHEEQVDPTEIAREVLAPTNYAEAAAQAIDQAGMRAELDANVRRQL